MFVIPAAYYLMRRSRKREAPSPDDARPVTDGHGPAPVMPIQAT
jgi:hypothetical protein